MADAPATQKVLTERRGAVLLVTLNAPERRNAIDQEMVDGLHQMLDAVTADATIAAVVIQGAGDKAFAAGADIAQLVEGVTKLSRISFQSREQAEAENYRKMIVAMATDIRRVFTATVVAARQPVRRGV